MKLVASYSLATGFVFVFVFFSVLHSFVAALLILKSSPQLWNCANLSPNKRGTTQKYRIMDTKPPQKFSISLAKYISPDLCWEKHLKRLRIEFLILMILWFWSHFRQVIYKFLQRLEFYFQAQSAFHLEKNWYHIFIIFWCQSLKLY